MSVRSPCILVVEDDRLTRQVIVQFLKRGGYTNILEASLAEQAIGILLKDRQTQVNLAIVDLMLPSASGLSIIRKLRNAKAAWRKNMPVAVMTGRTDTDTYKMAARRGIQAYLLKPVSAALLVETVGKLLAAHGIAPPKPMAPLENTAPIPAPDLPPSLDADF